MTSTLFRPRLGSRSFEGYKDCDYMVKAVLLGDIGVGKTTLLHTFLHGTCPAPRSVPKIAECCGKKFINYSGKTVKLTVWDTAGQERYRSLTASYFRGAHACIVVYDVTNEDSFNNVANWLQSVGDYCDTRSCNYTLLVGVSKGDNNCKSSGTHVDRQRAENLAAHYQIPYFEVDCHNDPKSVERMMDTMVNLVITRAVEDDQLSETIQPYAARLEQLFSKTEKSVCPGACAS